MISKFLKVFPLFLILLGCEKKYEYIEPRPTATVQVNFKDQSGSARNTISLYSAPDKYTPEQAWPLVVALHGHGDTAAAFHDLWKSVPKGHLKIATQFIAGKEIAYNPKVPQGTIETRYHKHAVFIRPLWDLRGFYKPNPQQ